MVLRRIGMSLHSAYTEKMTMDLIVGEEADKIKKAAQDESRKKKKKKKKDRMKDRKTEQTEKAQKEKDKKEQEEKEKKEAERKQQELLRRQREIKKTVTSLVMDIISNAEVIITKNKEAA